MKVILYTKDFNENIKEKVDVILSPQFYWIKKLEGVKNLKEANKIAKNIFKLKGDYIYKAIKIKDKFFAIAIDKNLNINIPKKYINSLRIAQAELYEYDNIKIDDNHFLKKVDDILFSFPYGEGVEFDKIKDSLKLSSYKFTLEEVNKKEVIFYFILLAFLNSYFLTQIFIYKNGLKEIENNLNTFLAKNNLPSTSFQLDSILNNLYSKVEKINYVKRGLNVFTKSRFKYKKIAYYNKIFEIEVKSNKNLDYFFKRYFKILTSKVKNNIYYARLINE